MAPIPGCTLARIEIAAIALLVLGYIAINIAADLPKFLIAENLVLATLYTLAAALIATSHRAGQPLTLFISAFNAGRVSRSIVTPRGEIEELALQHVPLLALILVVSIIALAILARGGC